MGKVLIKSVLIMSGHSNLLFGKFADNKLICKNENIWSCDFIIEQDFALTDLGWDSRARCEWAH